VIGVGFDVGCNVGGSRVINGEGVCVSMVGEGWGGNIIIGKMMCEYECYDSTDRIAQLEPVRS
jgi:hypothetical protein